MDLEVGAPYEAGGNISWVAPARRRSDGVDAVLKLQHPHPESAPEALALATWDGGGAVRLLAQDPLRRALLLERCAPGLPLGSEPDPCVAARVGAALGARLNAATPPPGLPILEAVQRAWADELERGLGDQPVVDPGLARLATATMRQRRATDARPALLHGDLNPTSVLSARREPWLAIDPKPMAGDAVCDGIRLVTQPDPRRTADPAGIVARRLEIVADGLGVDRGHLTEWCLAATVQMSVSAGARNDRETVERCREHAALLAVLLP